MADKRNFKTLVLPARRLVVGRNRSLPGERHVLQETP